MLDVCEYCCDPPLNALTKNESVVVYVRYFYDTPKRGILLCVLSLSKWGYWGVGGGGGNSGYLDSFCGSNVVWLVCAFLGTEFELRKNYFWWDKFFEIALHGRGNREPDFQQKKKVYKIRLSVFTLMVVVKRLDE